MDKERLSLEIRFELDQLRRLSEIVVEFQEALGDSRLPWHAAAGAKYVADLWNGIENLCKRRCVHLKRPMPTGTDWHQQLLDDFLAEPQLGGALSDEMKYRLKKYKSFRHRFVHGYGFEIDWKRVEEPLKLLPDTVAVLTPVWLTWLEAVC
ncbi:MAG: hypothetical protein EOM12_15015 [Verrucomicrobiae bacterium]|nr:hypothetical protein [Verrucomicrobiae bacterium]